MSTTRWVDCSPDLEIPDGAQGVWPGEDGTVYRIVEHDKANARLRIEPDHAWTRQADALLELPWCVWDATTMNQLGEFATEAEASAYIEEIRPLGRYGPDGHDLRPVRAEDGPASH